MLFTRNEYNHNNFSRVYNHPTDENRYIRIRCTETNEITSIELVKVWEIAEDHYDGKAEEFIAVGNLYLENVCHGEDNEVLDTNLLAMAENCFQEVR